jgi:Uncharacterized conserved protein
MEIYNKTKKVLLSSDAIAADTFIKRLKGMIGWKMSNSSKSILLIPCRSVHSFFMVFPIHLIFLDKKLKVVKIIKHFKPWRVSPYVWRAVSVMEIEAWEEELEVDEGDDLVIIHI